MNKTLVFIKFCVLIRQYHYWCVMVLEVQKTFKSDKYLKSANSDFWPLFEQKLCIMMKKSRKQNMTQLIKISPYKPYNVWGTN